MFNSPHPEASVLCALFVIKFVTSKKWSHTINYQTEPHYHQQNHIKTKMPKDLDSPYEVNEDDLALFDLLVDEDVPFESPIDSLPQMMMMMMSDRNSSSVSERGGKTMPSSSSPQYLSSKHHQRRMSLQNSVASSSSKYSEGQMKPLRRHLSDSSKTSSSRKNSSRCSTSPSSDSSISSSRSSSSKRSSSKKMPLMTTDLGQV